MQLPANAAELDALLLQKNYLKLAQVFRSANRFDDVVLNMNWQQRKVSSGASAFLNFTYIHDLDRVSSALGATRGADIKKTAVMMLLYAYELISIDGAKCKDASAPGHRMDQLLMSFPNVIKSIPALSGKDKDEIVKIALKYESVTASKRADDEFLCRDGLAQMQAAFNKFGDKAAREVPTPRGHVGRTMEVQADPDYKPEFVGKDIWEPKQAELRKSMPDLLRRLISSKK